MASTFDAITVQDIKDYHGFTGTSKDIQINAIRILVGPMIESYCRHDFQSITRTDEIPLIESRQDRFYTEFRPIASVSSLTENGQALIVDTDFHVENDIGLIEKISTLKALNDERRFGAFWTTARKGVKITYIGGEALSTATDVKIVFFEWVGVLAGIKIRTFITNEGIEATALLSLDNIPEAFSAILDRHRQERL